MHANQLLCEVNRYVANSWLTDLYVDKVFKIWILHACARVTVYLISNGIFQSRQKVGLLSIIIRLSEGAAPIIQENNSWEIVSTRM